MLKLNRIFPFIIVAVFHLDISLCSQDKNRGGLGLSSLRCTFPAMLPKVYGIGYILSHLKERHNSRSTTWLHSIPTSDLPDDLDYIIKLGLVCKSKEPAFHYFAKLNRAKLRALQSWELKMEFSLQSQISPGSWGLLLNEHWVKIKWNKRHLLIHLFFADSTLQNGFLQQNLSKGFTLRPWISFMANVH